MIINLLAIIGGILAIVGFFWFHHYSKEFTYADVQKYAKKHEGHLESKKREKWDEFFKKNDTGAPTWDLDEMFFKEYRNTQKLFATITIVSGMFLGALVGVFQCIWCVNL